MVVYVGGCLDGFRGCEESRGMCKYGGGYRRMYIWGIVVYGDKHI